MGALALGVILIIGYFFQSFHPYRRLELVRNTGYHIYFKAGLSGFLFLMTSILIWSFIDYFNLPSNLIDDLYPNNSFIYIKNTQYWTEFKAFAIFLLAFILSGTFIFFRRFTVDDKKLLQRVKGIAHELELLVINATIYVFPIRIELDCGKVYVGIPEKPNLEKGEVCYISLIPLLSGYVDEEKKIIFNNNYYRHYQQEQESDSTSDRHSSILDFSVVIPISQIVVASRFSIDAFLDFREKAELSELIGPPKPATSKD